MDIINKTKHRIVLNVGNKYNEEPDFKVILREKKTLFVDEDFHDLVTIEEIKIK